jgi:hypothetical protein
MPFETKTAFQANFSLQQILLHARLKFDLIIGQHSGFFFGLVLILWDLVLIRWPPLIQSNEWLVMVHLLLAFSFW